MADDEQAPTVASDETPVAEVSTLDRWAAAFGRILARPGARRWMVAVVAVVVVGVVVSLFTVGPFDSAARQQRLQDRALGVFTAAMTAWVADEANSRPATYTLDYLDPYLADPARGTMDGREGQMWGYDRGVVAVGVPYFAVTRSARLVDPLGHADASMGLTVCWVQGNLKIITPQGYSTSVTGPGPTAHVDQVFFKTTTGVGATPAAMVKTLRAYDIKDVTPKNGTCPLG